MAERIEESCKAVQNYSLEEQVGSAGPGLFWKLYKANPKSNDAQEMDAEVCVWLLDKQELTDLGQSKESSVNRLLEVYRKDAEELLNLRHPGIVKLIEPLDETASLMAMVTEPVLCSLANVLKQFDNIKEVSQELRTMEISLPNKMAGLGQLSKSLVFLHEEAKVVHRNINPSSVIITSEGAWKLAGFGQGLYLDEFVEGER